MAEWYTQQVEGLCRKRRGGSSPLEGTQKMHASGQTALDAIFVNDIYGRLAQLVRAAALHAVGQGFESLVAHL